MIGRVHACGEATAHAITAISVARHFDAEPMRFVHHGLDFFECQRRAVHQCGVGFPHMQNTLKILGSVDLHPIDAVQLGLAHRGARLPWPVQILSFRVALIEP